MYYLETKYHCRIDADTYFSPHNVQQIDIVYYSFCSSSGDLFALYCSNSLS